MKNTKHYRNFLLCGIAVSLFACADVKEGLKSADQTLQSTFGTEDEAAAQTEFSNPPSASDERAEAESLYRQGQQARAAGNHVAALRSFEAAATRDHPAAAYETGLAYAEGSGTQRDVDQAATWLNRATELKEPRALYLAGINYQTGLDVEKDPATAAAYFGEAATGGHVQAQIKLAEAFANGDGVPKDLAWAQRWYGKAAWQGAAEAQFSYGILMAAGRGFAKDRASAHAWLVLAAGQGHKDAATAEAALAKLLTRAERQQSDRWRATYRPGPGPANADRPTLRYVQQRLTDSGYRPGPVDGLMGPRTRTSIADYRAKAGLPGGVGVDAALVNHLFESAHGAG